VDVQVVAAAQIPLTAAVASGKFRADLCARLQGVALQVPPLRARRADVLPLFHELLRVNGLATPFALEAGLAEKLCLESWPLNVRQLENVARRALVFYGNQSQLPLRAWAELAPEQLADAEADAEARAEESAGDRRAYSTDEVAALKAVLARNGNNVSHAASELGITRGKAYRMLKSGK
jgi:DNA-binding NtrC family response regulator